MVAVWLVGILDLAIFCVIWGHNPIINLRLQLISLSSVDAVCPAGTSENSPAIIPLVYKANAPKAPDGAEENVRYNTDIRRVSNATVIERFPRVLSSLRGLNLPGGHVTHR